MARLLLVFWLLAGAGVAMAGGFSVQPTPQWIEDTAVPIADARHIGLTSDGVYYLLVDDQVSWEDDIRLSYQRITRQVVNRSGLEEVAAIVRSYDPAFEDLDLLFVRRIRGDAVADLTQELTVNQYQRETDLERGIIDGSQTIHMDLPDVQVGDIIDVGFLWREAPIVPGATLSGRYGLEFSVPVGLTQLLLHWPSDRTIDVQLKGDDVTFTQTATEGLTQYRWRRDDITPVPGEDHVPLGRSTRATVSYSGLPDWSTVQNGLNDYYTQDHQVPAQWAERLAQIRAENATPEQQAVAALRLVQEEIRYVGVEIGAGGFYARDPAQVVAQGFGDCKDKSVLLATLLHDLGIEADVALAHTDRGHTLPDQLPSPRLFNHMITRVRIDGKTRWMDPTLSYEGGSFSKLVTPDYGHVLPLDQEADGALAYLTQTEDSIDRVHVRENFRFIPAGMYLNVSTSYSGAAANEFRSYAATTPLRDIQRRYLRYYLDSYPGMQVHEEIRVDDTISLNRIQIEEVYFLPRVALNEPELQRRFRFQADYQLNNFPDVQIGTRRAPLFVPHRSERLHNISVENAPIEFEAPDDLFLVNPAFSYIFHGIAFPGGGMNLSWRYSSRTHEVPAEQVADVIEDVRAAQLNGSYVWRLRADDDLEAPSFIDRMLENYGLPASQ